MKKIIVPGLAAGVVILVVKIVFDVGFKAVFPESGNCVPGYICVPVAFHEPDPSWILITDVMPFVLGLILAWIWRKMKFVAGADVWKEIIGFSLVCWAAVVFSLIYWQITTYDTQIHGNIFSGPQAMLAFIFVDILVQLLAGSYVLAKVDK